MDYKTTLNLPQTNFSMKANLALLEPQMISYWEKLNIYGRLRKERAGKEKFILHDGPPYANGLIHIGHALNKILKDIIVKYKILQGYDSPFILGWDCHGLPVEHQLFKEIKKTKHDVEISDFRKKAKDYALKFVDLQAKDFQRLGIFSDWGNPYLTLNPEYESEVIKLLGFLVKESYIYRGLRPVNWCGVCETALAEAEVEYSDKESDSIYVLFRSEPFEVSSNLAKFKTEGDIYFLVWTTTPWTLISNVAVAVHPELEYSLIKLDNKKVIVATNLLSSLEEKLNRKFTVLDSYLGNIFAHTPLKHPFLDRKSRIVLANFVSKEEGSGCVHIAPGHGEDDFSLAKSNSLDIIMPVNEKGVFDSNAPEEFRGMNIKKASESVIVKMQNNKTLVKQEKIVHSYPHCWRCKNPIIFRATSQWFLEIDRKELRQKLLSAVDKVNWVPSSGKERIKSMLILRPDWCLSRQRLWGVPIPAFKCNSCSKVILNEDTVSRTAEIFKKQGSDIWFTADLKNFISQDFSCDNCGGKNFSKEFDILDVWFESGASFTAVVKNSSDLSFPADVYLEGSDQHRGWFQASLIPSVAKDKIAPFKTTVTHGFVVDGEGRKMSKSLGNVIAPQEIYKKYGAEILRLWAAYADYSEDIKISEDIIKQMVDIYRKVRNTIRFILGNIADFDREGRPLNYDSLTEVDKFMLSRATLAFKEVCDCYEDFSFYKVCQKIFNFCNMDMSSFYLDILKDRLYTFPQNSIERRSAQSVLSYILDLLLKLIAPILPFTAEEAYLNYKGVKENESVFIRPLDKALINKWLNPELTERWNKLLDLRVKVLKEIERYRETGAIGSSLEAEVVLELKAEDHRFFSPYINILKEIFIVSSVIINEGDSIIIKKAKGKKCLRCWNWSETTDKNTDYPNICNKCIKALKEVKK